MRVLIKLSRHSYYALRNAIGSKINEMSAADEEDQCVVEMQGLFDLLDTNVPQYDCDLLIAFDHPVTIRAGD